MVRDARFLSPRLLVALLLLPLLAGPPWGDLPQADEHPHEHLVSGQAAWAVDASYERQESSTLESATPCRHDVCMACIKRLSSNADLLALSSETAELQEDSALLPLPDDPVRDRALLRSLPRGPPALRIS